MISTKYDKYDQQGRAAFNERNTTRPSNTGPPAINQQDLKKNRTRYNAKLHNCGIHYLTVIFHFTHFKIKWKSALIIPTMWTKLKLYLYMTVTNTKSMFLVSNITVVSIFSRLFSFLRITWMVNLFKHVEYI
jgi:hypothetical protein